MITHRIPYSEVPKGEQALFEECGYWIAVDNRDGEGWVEAFHTKEEAEKWLAGEWIPDAEGKPLEIGEELPSDEELQAKINEFFEPILKRVGKQIDVAFVNGLGALSDRKKRRIVKWVIKQLEKEKRKRKKR